MKTRLVIIVLAALVLAACSCQNGADADIAPTVQALQTQTAGIQATASAVAVTPAAAAAGSQAGGEEARNAAPGGAATPAAAGEQAAATAAAEKDQAVPVVTDTPTPTPSPLGTVSTSVDHAVNITGQSGVRFTFRNARWVKQAGGFQPMEGYRWLAVDVTISNPPDNAPVDYTPLWFSLALGDESILPVPIVDGGMMSLLTIPPGGQMRGTLVFSLPQGFAEQQVYTLQVQDAALPAQPPVMVRVEAAGDD